MNARINTVTVVLFDEQLAAVLEVTRSLRAAYKVELEAGAAHIAPHARAMSLFARSLYQRNEHCAAAAIKRDVALNTRDTALYVVHQMGLRLKVKGIAPKERARLKKLQAHMQRLAEMLNW